MYHSFDIAHAEKYGIPEAVLISNFQFWIAKNKANGENSHHGRTWTYNSVRAYAALFPYMSQDQVRRALERLVKLEVLVVGNYNEVPTDQTKWYAFKEESAFIPAIPHLADLPNRTGKSASPIGKSAKSLINTDVNTDVNFDPPSPKKQAKGSRITADWVLPKKYGEWALAEYPDWTAEFVRARGAKFMRHWSTVSGRDGVRLDWFPVWQNFCLTESEFLERTSRATTSGGTSSPWWASDQSILAEGKKHSLVPRAGETMVAFKGRVQSAIDGQGTPPTVAPSPAITITPTGPTKLKISEKSKAVRAAAIQAAKELTKKGKGAQAE